MMAINPQFINDENGKHIMVVLPIDEYLELMEDLEDLAAIAQRKDEPAIPLEIALKEIGYGKQD
ncbi:MAG: hypothetical protein ACRER2_12660 [Methylococcales bacterium]